MKKIILIGMTFLLSLFMAAPVWADDSGYIRDSLNVLDANEDRNYEKIAEKIAQENHIQTYFVSTEVSAEELDSLISGLYQEIGTQTDAVILVANYGTNIGETYYLGKSKDILKVKDDQFFWKAYAAENTVQDGIEAYLATVSSVFKAPSRLIDEADLLSDSEEKELLTQLDDVSKRQKLDVVVVTVDSLRGKIAEAFADDYYDYHHYGQGDAHDGVLLLVSMEDRDWHVSTTGYGIYAITDAGLDYLSDKFLPDLSAGDYAASFSTFAKLVDDFVTQAKTGKPYDRDNLPKEPLSLLWIPVAGLLGLVIAWGITAWMKGQLYSVHSQYNAREYMKKDSFKLTKSQDLFLYKNVTSRPRPRSNDSSGFRGGGGSSTHISSSGISHGGGGGKF